MLPSRPPSRRYVRCAILAQTGRNASGLIARIATAQNRRHRYPSTPSAHRICRREEARRRHMGKNFGYFLAGVGIGTLVGVLTAPRSGEETRDYLSKRADEGRQYAQRKARELRERAEDFVERGKQVASDQKDLITGALDVGREAYLREKAKEI